MPDIFLEFKGVDGESAENKLDDTFEFKAPEGTGQGNTERDGAEWTVGDMAWDDTKHIKWESPPPPDETAPIDPVVDYDIIA